MSRDRKTPSWRRYLRFFGPNIERDVDDELRFHIEMRMKEFIARGMSEADARQAIRERLGDVDTAKAESVRILNAGARDARRAGIVESVSSDLRFALRSLRRAPGWTAVVLLTIALGVGATTTVFSVADSLLLHPLNYPDLSSVVVITRRITLGANTVSGPMRLEALRAWQAGAHSITHLEPFTRQEVQLGEGDDATTIDAGVIDSGFFSLAGARPIIGRGFSAADMLPNSQKVVLLSEGAWKSKFAGAHDIVGRQIQLANATYTIIGVAPLSMTLPDIDLPRSDVWLPFVVGPGERTTSALARLTPGASPATAAAELQGILDRTAIDPMPGLTATMVVEHPTDTFAYRRGLLMLIGAVALLLLVACINLAHLLLARGVSRERELAVRYALGAGRARLVRLLIVESLVIAVGGAVLAIVVGWAGLRFLAASHPAKMFALAHVTAGTSLIVVASIVACALGITIGSLTALRVARSGIGESLRGATFSARAGGGRLRAMLVVGEVALSAVLLVGALLLIHTVYDLQRTRLGFDAHHLYSVTFRVRGSQLTQSEQRRAFAELLRAEAQRLPGVSGVSISDTRPTNARRLLATLESEEHPAPPNAVATATPSTIVATDYFKTMRMPLFAGHTFDTQSAANNEIIISETLARAIWPNGSAIGHRLRQAEAPATMPAWTVVGIVPDIVTRTLLDRKPEPAIYRPIANDWDGAEVTLLVRLNTDAGIEPLRKLALNLRPGGALPVIVDVEQSINETAAEPRFTMVVLITFATLSIVLAATGLYSVIAYTVAQRTREIGVRLALGATRAMIARLVVGNGLRLATSGVMLGLVGSIAATRVVEHLLYGVSRLDPFSFIGGAVFLIVTSVLACIVPTLRATSVDPIIAVRAE